MSKLKKVRTHTAIRRLDMWLEPFAPLGFHKRKQRAAWWAGALRRNPTRYINNNGLVCVAVCLYDTLHQGPDWWFWVHLAVIAPSLLVMYKAFQVWVDQSMAEEGGE